MKTLKTLLLLTTILSISACAQLKQVAQGPTINAIDNTSALPTGTYFIINAGGGALTPLNPGVGENVFLRPFTQSGVQKWQVTQHKTSKGVVSYTKWILTYNPTQEQRSLPFACGQGHGQLG